MVMKSYSRIYRLLFEKESEKEKQMAKGVKVEKEHKDLYDDIKEYLPREWTLEKFAGRIANAHVSEFIDYYDRLAILEKEARKALKS
jgi:hypothetical protein